jgi:hypothetical protein
MTQSLLDSDDRLADVEMMIGYNEKSRHPTLTTFPFEP